MKLFASSGLSKIPQVTFYGVPNPEPQALSTNLIIIISAVIVGIVAGISIILVHLFKKRSSSNKKVDAQEKEEKSNAE